MIERITTLLSSLTLLSLSSVALAAPASLLQPHLLDTESYGETFTATVELSNGAANATVGARSSDAGTEATFFGEASPSASSAMVMLYCASEPS